MVKIKLKKAIIITVIAICLGVSEFTGVLPYAAARVTSSIYITINYPESGLKFQSGEYDYYFGYYMVSYKDKTGKGLGLMLFPKCFPIFIIHDTIKGQA